MELPPQLRRRVAIDRVSPEVDGGRFPAKRLLGEPIEVVADIVCDGHEELECRLHVRHGQAGPWRSLPLQCEGNDRWVGRFTADSIGHWDYTVSARVDPFAGWLRDLRRRHEAGQNLTIELACGAAMIEEAAARADPAEAGELSGFADRLRQASSPDEACSPRLAELMTRWANRRDETWLPPRPLWIDRPLAGCSSWYEIFPRSWGEPGIHGSLADVAERLEYVRDLGFNVLYLTPIHPIGTAFRKGRNNSLTAAPGDVGSPWAIGSAEGGHTAIHPALGTLDDFERLRGRAESLGIELALDLAIQCSPDHPWVREHPEWFRWRPDGTIRYAENPPKKYQDIVALDFEGEAWESLWKAIEGVVRCWVERGVKIFRVDNPHTKPFAFWEWLIGEIHRDHPDVLFLSEAFTRPKTMYRLAKLGFTQSYTYFTWRVEKGELADYLVEVTSPPVRDFFRPNFWPNTPDILHETLQTGGRAMFITRMVLAAMSVGSWGIYGPAFELMAATPREPGSEEYLDSEKYEIKDWNLLDPASLAPLVTRINAIRREEPAAALPPPVIQRIDEPQLLAWSRFDKASGSRLVVVVSLDPNEPRSGLLELDRRLLGLDDSQPLQACELLAADGAGECGRPVTWPAGPVEVTLAEDRPAVIYRLTPVTPAAAREAS